MSSHQKQDMNVDGVSEKDVVEFLQTHPNFFDNHINLLAELRLPHPTGNAVSLIERQVHVLRDSNKKLEQKLNNLIQIARDNDRLNTRTQKLALVLLEASTLDDIYYSLQEILLNDFEANSMSLRLFIEPKETCGLADIFTSRDTFTQGMFDKFFSTNKPICGSLNSKQADFLFHERAEKIKSAALIPVCDNECFGMLAIGSEDEKRFHHAMGTVFLSHIGAMVGRRLRHFLK